MALGAYGLARWGYYAYGSRFAAGASAATVVKCFGAGTPVHTEQGQQPIEDIEVGDSVWSIDEETGEVTLEKVTQLFKTPEQQVLELELEDDSGATETLVVTPEHPFLTERGWIAAQELTENDRIRQRSGGWLRLTSATWVQGTATVYNFEVGGTHTYAVGEAGVWVHNACGSLRGFHGTTAKNVLGILDEGAFIPNNAGEVFLSRNAADTFIHGVDSGRALSIEVRVAMDSARAIYKSLPGNPQSIVLRSRSNIPVVIERLFIRTGSRVDGFTTQTIEGADAIRAFLAR